MKLSRKSSPIAQPHSEHEIDVLRMVAQGKNNGQIADELVLSRGTVRAHMSNILGNLHQVSGTQATLYALW